MPWTLSLALASQPHLYSVAEESGLKASRARPAAEIRRAVFMAYSPRGSDGGEHETRDAGAEEHHKDGIGPQMRARDDGATLSPTWNTMNMFSVRPLLLSLLVSALAAGCASTPRLDRNLERIGFGDSAAAVDGNALFRRIGAEPTNARLHFDNGRYLLERGRRGDLEVARVAFANATR